MDRELIDEIYEAAVVPDLWPRVLDRLNDVGHGYATFLFTASRDEMRWLSSARGGYGAEYVAEGWPARTDRAVRLLEARHAGFLGDLDVYTREEMDREPVFTEFLRPRGIGWGAATAVQVPNGDTLIFDVERRIETGPVESETIERLDSLRPHLARAGLLSARLAFERVRAGVLALEHAGLAAGVLGHGGALISANPLFEAMIPTVIADRPGRVVLADRSADALFAGALERLRRPGFEAAASLPVAAREGRPPLIVNLLPIRRAAQDVFANAVAIMIVIPVVRAQVPTAELLQGLFDLTAAEARVARGVADLVPVEQIAAALGVSRETVRSQLKSVMAKTGMPRQGDLAALLAGASLHTD